MKFRNTFELRKYIAKSYSNHSIFWDYVLVFLLIATSGITYFYFNEEYIVIGLFLSLMIFIVRKILDKIEMKFILVLSIFIIWDIFQSYYFQSFSLKAIIGSATRFIFAYLVIKSVGERFLDTYINIIYFFSIISLLFYITFFFPPIINKVISLALTKPFFPLKNEFYEFNPNYVIVTFNQYKQFRNSGPFWEPGAFSVFLNIAILFNILTKNKIVNKKNLVFIIAIISTLSTAGFLALFFIITSVFLIINPSLKKTLSIVPIIILFTILIINVPFLLPKIQNNVIIAENDNSSRFGSAFSDYQLIYKNPILGYGKDIENKYGTSNWDMKEMHRNNGITNFITQWGLIVFIIYFYYYKKSADKICLFFKTDKNLSYVFLITILLLGFSQGLFQYPFFHSLMFLQFIYKY